MPFQKRIPGIVHGDLKQNHAHAIASFERALVLAFDAGAQKIGEPQVFFQDGKYLVLMAVSWPGSEKQEA